MDPQGAPQAGVPVAVTRQGELVGSAKTDASGRFTFSELSGGIYEVQTAHALGVYRLWAPQTAPPVAQNSVLLVNGDEVVRGAWFGGGHAAGCECSGCAKGGGGGALGFLANPWVLAGIVAAAIAIPLALDDDDAS